MHQILFLDLSKNFFFNFAPGLKYFLAWTGAWCSCLAAASASASHQLLLQLIWQRYQRLRYDDFWVVGLIHSLWKPYFTWFNLDDKLDARAFVLSAAAAIERVKLVTHKLKWAFFLPQLLLSHATNVLVLYKRHLQLLKHWNLHFCWQQLQTRLICLLSGLQGTLVHRHAVTTDSHWPALHNSIDQTFNCVFKENVTYVADRGVSCCSDWRV